MSFNLPKTDKKRVVIVGGGFGGLKLANKLRNSNFQVVLVDRNNYHQFPPLIYQIASAGIEPSSISFPFRKIFQKRKNFFYRMAEVRSIFPEHKIIQTSIGKVKYDYLVLAAGATTNFFGNKNVAEEAMPMKNVSEAMGLRNALLDNFERALTCATDKERQELLNVVIVGGGATGVEIAGALSEMKNFVLPTDYPDLPTSLMNIYLIEAGPRLLPAMSPESSQKVEKYLRTMGVNVLLNKMVTDWKDHNVMLKDGSSIATRTFIWVSVWLHNLWATSTPRTWDADAVLWLTPSTRWKDLTTYSALATSASCPKATTNGRAVTRSWHKWPFNKATIWPRTLNALKRARR